MQKILIRGNNWLGDAVMSIPLLEALHQKYPQAVLDVLSKESIGDLYRLLPYTKTIHAFSGRIGLKGSFRLASRLKPHQYDACFILPRSFSSAMAPFLAGIPMRIGYRAEGRSLLLTHRIRRDPLLLRTHRTRYYMNLFSPFGSVPEPVMPRITSGEETERWCDEFMATASIPHGTPLIGFNVGAAYGTAKQWRPERFAQVAKHLIRKWNAHALYFGSQREAAHCTLVHKITGPSSHNLAGQTTLLQLAGLIRRCRLFVTNDTGPMHVASLMDVPVVAIFGPTDPVTTAPYTKRWSMVRREVECSPCLLRTCPIDHRCMERVAVADVLQAAEPWLESKIPAGD